MTRILTISSVVILAAGILIALGFIRKDHNHSACSNIRISINYQNSDTLISSDEIMQMLISGFDTIEGRVLQPKDIAGMKNLIAANPYIAYCDVDFMLNGALRIRATQRTPILRITNGSQAWFVDDKAVVMPRHNSFSARVTVAGGHLDHTRVLKAGNDLQALADTNAAFASGNLYELITLAKYIHNHQLLNRMVEQIYVNASGEFELFTIVGRQRILFGRVDDMEEKFNKLLIFYQAGPSVNGLNQYRTINLKYNNQVVCSKS